MQRIDGCEPLSPMLAAAALSDASWRAIGATLARLHQAGVDHADLNAHNILLDRPGRGQRHRLRSRPRARSRRLELRKLRRLRRSLEKVSRDLPPGRFSAEAWASCSRATGIRGRESRRSLSVRRLYSVLMILAAPVGVRGRAGARIARSSYWSNLRSASDWGRRLEAPSIWLHAVSLGEVIAPQRRWCARCAPATPRSRSS